MPKEVQDPLPGWAGGANSRDAPIVAPDDALDIVNMMLDERGGGASKRSGMRSVASLSARVISAYTFYRGAANVPQVLGHFSDGSLRYSVNEGATWTNITTGLSTANPMAFETFNTKCYMCNGVDSYASWSGSVYTTFASAPKGKFLRVWKDTMWVAGTNDDRVYSSDPADAETFGVSSFVDIAKGDGDSITGLDTDGNVLIVPKRRRAFVIYDPTTFANRLFDYEKGAESHFSFVHFEGQIYYLTERGIAVFLGDSPSQIISGKIDPLFQADILNFSKLNLAWGYTHQNRIGWSVVEAGETVPGLQIEHYPRLEKKPFAFHRMPAQCLVTVRTGTTEKLYAGKATGNKWLEAFADGVGTDDGVPFSGVIETAWFDLQSPLLTKYIRRLRIAGRGKFFISFYRNFLFSAVKTFSLDLSGPEKVWNTDNWNDPGDVWGPLANIASTAIHPNVYGRHISLRISDSESNSGHRPVDVGDKTYNLDTGEWAFYGATFHGVLMGSDL